MDCCDDENRRVGLPLAPVGGHDATASSREVDIISDMRRSNVHTHHPIKESRGLMVESYNYIYHGTWERSDRFGFNGFFGSFGWWIYKLEKLP
jgi:hypothetical protein